MEKSSFFNSVNGDRKYKAEDYANYFNSFIGNGVFPNPSTNLKVISNDNMTVTLESGKAWINGYMYENTDNLILNIDVADGALNRIDRVVLRLDYLNREIRTVVKKGTFASSPVAQSLQRDNDIYELGLADIRINKGAISILQTNITDTRLDMNLCGITNSLISVDVGVITNQFSDNFNAWFDSIKGQLNSDPAGSLYNMITETNLALENKADTLDLDSHKLEDSTLLKKGHVKLNDNIDSTSTTEAGTANAVKKAYDKGVEALNSRLYHYLDDSIGKLNKRISHYIDSGMKNYDTVDLTYSSQNFSQSYEYNPRCYVDINKCVIRVTNTYNLNQYSRKIEFRVRLKTPLGTFYSPWRILNSDGNRTFTEYMNYTGTTKGTVIIGLEVNSQSADSLNQYNADLELEYFGNKYLKLNER